MIEVENITKKYGEKTVLDHVSTTIEKESITALIGPNGAGKSTLLGIIGRILDQDSGSVAIDGKQLGDYSPDELSKKIAMLKQQNNLQVRLTVRELVAFGRYPHSKGRLNSTDNVHINDAIAFMNLEELEHRFIDTLSGGERQRAFIAMTIAQDTEYIFLDEPLNNLDMKHSVDIMKTLSRLCAERNKTVLIVLHDINFASFYSDNILALKDGKLHTNSTRDRVISEDVLKDLYDIDFNIYDLQGEKVCVFYEDDARAHTA